MRLRDALQFFCFGFKWVFAVYFDGAILAGVLVCGFVQTNIISFSFEHYGFYMKIFSSSRNKLRFTNVINVFQHICYLVYT